MPKKGQNKGKTALGRAVDRSNNQATNASPERSMVAKENLVKSKHGGGGLKMDSGLTETTGWAQEATDLIAAYDKYMAMYADVEAQLNQQKQLNQANSSQVARFEKQEGHRKGWEANVIVNTPEARTAVKKSIEQQLPPIEKLQADVTAEPAKRAEAERVAKEERDRIDREQKAIARKQKQGAINGVRKNLEEIQQAVKAERSKFVSELEKAFTLWKECHIDANQQPDGALQERCTSGLARYQEQAAGCLKEAAEGIELLTGKEAVDAVPDDRLDSLDEIDRPSWPLEGVAAELDKQRKSLIANLGLDVLTSTEEVRLANGSRKLKEAASKGKAPTGREMSQVITEVIEEVAQKYKWDSALEYLEEYLAPEEISSKKPKKKKASEEILEYLNAHDKAVVEFFNKYMRARSEDLLGRAGGPSGTLKATQSLKALGTADAEEIKWLFKLYMDGADTAILPKYLAAKAQLKDVPLPSAFREQLNDLMATAFNPAVFTGILANAGGPDRAASAVAAFLHTKDAAIAKRVAEDDFGLFGTMPDHGVEKKLGQGVRAGVIVITKGRTSRTTATSSGHKYNFQYIGSTKQSLYELHVHEKAQGELYPAWKPVSNPYMFVPGRADYQIDGALRSVLT